MAIKKTLKWGLIGLVVAGVAMLAVRSYNSLGGPVLQPWHTFVPVELRAQELDGADWARYMAQEEAIFKSVRAEVKAASGSDVFRASAFCHAERTCAESKVWSTADTSSALGLLFRVSRYESTGENPAQMCLSRSW